MKILNHFKIMYGIDALLGENTPNARAICMELNMNQGKTRIISGSLPKKKNVTWIFFSSTPKKLQ